MKFIKFGESIIELTGAMIIKNIGIDEDRFSIRIDLGNRFNELSYKTEKERDAEFDRLEKMLIKE